MRLSRRNPSWTAGVLILLCVGLLAVVLLQLDHAPLSRVARSTPSPAPDGTPLVGLQVEDLEFEMPALSLYADITARPLFSPDRRPPAVEETPSVKAEPAPVSRDLVLRGVATAGKERVALIEERATGKLVRVSEGQSVGGWRLVAIEQEAVELEGRDDRLVLEVEKDSSPPAAQQAEQRRRQRDDDRRRRDVIERARATEEPPQDEQ